MTARLVVAVALWVWMLAGDPFPAAGQSAGAVTLTAEQERDLADLRRLVDETTRIYQRDRIQVRVVSWVGSKDVTTFAAVGVVYSPVGFLYVAPGVLASRGRDVVIAATLGYHILRAPSRARTLAEYERENVQRRLDANAKAVEILVKARGMPERDALERVYQWLYALHRFELGQPGPVPKDRVPACDQIRDLLARFPQQREAMAGRECAPPG